MRKHYIHNSLLDAMEESERMVWQGAMLEHLQELSLEEKTYYSYGDLTASMHRKLRSLERYQALSQRAQIALLFELCHEMEALADDDEELQLYIICHQAELQDMPIKPNKEAP